MQIIDIWDKLHIYGRKIGFTFLFSCLIMEGFAQKQWSVFNQSGGDNQTFSYGFFLAGHTSSLRIKYSEAFLDPEASDIRNVRSIMPAYSPGFDLGFLLTTRLHDQVNILITPKVGFYEYRTEVDFYSEDNTVDPGLINTGSNSVDKSHLTLLTEETLVELPILFKYKSQRFNNTRMFFSLASIPNLGRRSRTRRMRMTLFLLVKTWLWNWVWALTFILNTLNSLLK